MKKAYSLTELIIVMAIITILAAVVIPTVRSFSPYFQLNNSTKLILIKLRQAQEEAITVQDQNSLRFNLEVNPTTFQLIRIAGQETVLEEGELAKDVTLSFEPAFDPSANKEVVFSSDGGPNWSGNINVTLGSNSKIINVSPAGVIKIQ